MESILTTPNLRQASQLNFLLILLLMVNAVFLFATDPTLGSLGYGKWVVAFFIPPIQYGIQRFVYWVSVRLGLLMFSSSRLPNDPLEKRHKQALVSYVFPFVLYPVLFCFVFSSMFESPVLQALFSLIGLISMFALITHALKQIYNLNTAPAFWGPFVVQMLIAIVVVMIMGLILMLYGLTHSFAP